MKSVSPHSTRHHKDGDAANQQLFGKWAKREVLSYLFYRTRSEFTFFLPNPDKPLLLRTNSLVHQSATTSAIPCIPVASPRPLPLKLPPAVAMVSGSSKLKDSEVKKYGSVQYDELESQSFSFSLFLACLSSLFVVYALTLSPFFSCSLSLFADPRGSRGSGGGLKKQ